MSDEEKRLLSALGKRIPPACHVWMTNLGIPLIVALLVAVAGEQIWVRDSIRDDAAAIVQMRETLDRHGKLLGDLETEVTTLWTLVRKEPPPHTGTP